MVKAAAKNEELAQQLRVEEDRVSASGHSRYSRQSSRRRLFITRPEDGTSDTNKKRNTQGPPAYQELYKMLTHLAGNSCEYEREKRRAEEPLNAAYTN